jgi:hypothetical protein
MIVACGGRICGGPREAIAAAAEHCRGRLIEQKNPWLKS